MSRMIAVFVGTVALSFVTTVAGAEERAPEGPIVLVADDSADAPAVEVAGGLMTVAADAPDFEPLTEDELAVLEEAAARNPELEDKAGGYVSNDELLTIVVVVLLVIIVL